MADLAWSPNMRHLASGIDYTDDDGVVHTFYRLHRQDPYVRYMRTADKRGAIFGPVDGVEKYGPHSTDEEFAQWVINYLTGEEVGDAGSVEAGEPQPVR